MTRVAKDKMGLRPAEPDAGPKPWDRLEDESPAAFIAFSYYRDMGPARSVRSAWALFAPKSNQPVNSSWFVYSTKHNWAERAAAYDLSKQREEAERRQQLAEAEFWRVAENQRRFRDNEAYLAEQAQRKAREILSVPLVQDSFVEQKDGKTIIHKASLLTPAYLFAAAALLKAASDVGRRAHQMTEDGDEKSISIEAFRRLFYKHTGDIAADLPEGALPVMPDNPAVKPDIHLPNDPAGVVPAGGNGAAPVASSALTKFKPARERP